MRKTVRFCFSSIACIQFLIVGVTCFGAPSVSRPRLAVFAFGNETGSPVYDAVCAGAGRSLALTLHQLALYDLQTVPRLVGGTEEALRVAALEQRADYLMYGGVSAAGKSLVFRLALYDRAKGATSIRRESKPVSSLDLFEAVDDVILATLSGITGGHIGFGAVDLVNRGEKGTYQVFLDGMAAGEDLAELGRVLAGPHTITVVQRRMLGEAEIERRSLEVAEGGRYEVAFAVPYLSEPEKARIEGLEESIRSSRRSPAAAAAVEKQVATLGGLLRDVSYSPRLADYQERARQLEAEWKILKNRFAIEERAWAPESALLDRSIVIYLTAEDYPDPASLKRGVEENASLLATLLEMAAGRAVAAADYDAGVALVESILDFSRYLDPERKAEYAVAIATLRDLFAHRAADPAKFERDLRTVFGAQMEAGVKFAGLEAEAKRSGRAVLLSSDAGAEFSVGGGPAAALPVLLPVSRASVAVARAADAAAAADAEELEVPAGRRIVFLAGGFHGFGRAAAAVAGPAAAPLRFRNVPDGYTVYVDDAKVGVTPLGQVMVKEGLVLIRFEKAGEKPRTMAANTSADKVETAEWGRHQDFPIRLSNRTVSLRGNAADWEGLEPIVEGSFRGGGFFYNPAYAVTKVTMCRDKRFLYWRIDFADQNPFDKAPKGVGKRYCAELGLLFEKGRRLNIGLMGPRDEKGFGSYFGIWDEGARKWTHKGDNVLSVKPTPGFLEVRIPLSRIMDYFKSPVQCQVQIANLPNGKDWESWPIRTPLMYIEVNE